MAKRKDGSAAAAETAQAHEQASRDLIWPDLPLAAWQDTYQTLHLWTQIVGKVRLALSPPVNHWWATRFTRHRAA